MILTHKPHKQNVCLHAKKTSEHAVECTFPHYTLTNGVHACLLSFAVYRPHERANLSAQGLFLHPAVL